MTSVSKCGASVPHLRSHCTWRGTGRACQSSGFQGQGSMFASVWRYCFSLNSIHYKFLFKTGYVGKWPQHNACVDGSWSLTTIRDIRTCFLHCGRKIYKLVAKRIPERKNQLEKLAPKGDKCLGHIGWEECDIINYVASISGYSKRCKLDKEPQGCAGFIIQ